MIALGNACCKSKQLLNPDWRLSFEALVSISDFSDESSDGFAMTYGEALEAPKASQIICQL
jgi:hypothetical protein